MNGEPSDPPKDKQLYLLAGTVRSKLQHHYGFTEDEAAVTTEKFESIIKSLRFAKEEQIARHIFFAALWEKIR